MSAMSILINIETEEGPGAQSYNGVDVSDAQAFMAGVTDTPSLVTAVMSCVTTGSEARSLNRSCGGEGCMAFMTDIDSWLTENAAYE